MDSSLSDSTNVVENNHPNIISTCVGDQNSSARSLDKTDKTLSPSGDEDPSNVIKSPAFCVSPSKDIVLKLVCDDDDEQSSDKFVDEIELLKDSDDESISKVKNESKLSEILTVEDSDSDDLDGDEIEKSVLLKKESNITNDNSDQSLPIAASTVKKSLKDPNVMLEIPSYLEISNDKYNLLYTWDMTNNVKKNNDSVSIINNKDLNDKSATTSPNCIEDCKTKENQSSIENLLLKTLKDEEKMLDEVDAKNTAKESNLESEFLKSHKEKKLLDDEPIIIESEEPESEVINIIDDDDILQPPKKKIKKDLSVNRKLENALIELKGSVTHENMFPEKCAKVYNEVSADIEDLTQSDDSFISDIHLANTPSESDCEVIIIAEIPECTVNDKDKTLNTSDKCDQLLKDSEKTMIETLTKTNKSQSACIIEEKPIEPHLTLPSNEKIEKNKLSDEKNIELIIVKNQQEVSPKYSQILSTVKDTNIDLKVDEDNTVCIANQDIGVSKDIVQTRVELAIECNSSTSKSIDKEIDETLLSSSKTDFQTKINSFSSNSSDLKINESILSTLKAKTSNLSQHTEDSIHEKIDPIASLSKDAKASSLEISDSCKSKLIKKINDPIPPTQKEIEKIIDPVASTLNKIETCTDIMQDLRPKILIEDDIMSTPSKETEEKQQINSKPNDTISSISKDHKKENPKADSAIPSSKNIKESSEENLNLYDIILFTSQDPNKENLKSDTKEENLEPDKTISITSKYPKEVQQVNDAISPASKAYEEEKQKVIDAIPSTAKDLRDETLKPDDTILFTATNSSQNFNLDNTNLFESKDPKQENQKQNAKLSTFEDIKEEKTVNLHNITSTCEKENLKVDYKVQFKLDHVIPSTSQNCSEQIPQDFEIKLKPHDPIPSTSQENVKQDDTVSSTSKDYKENDKPIDNIEVNSKSNSDPPIEEPQTSLENEPIPSTSKTGEEQDTSDSLGLLAESSCVMEDDEDQEDDDDGDDEEEFDADYESSNQMTAEISEDSNTLNVEGEFKESSKNNITLDRPFEFNTEKDQQEENTMDVNENEEVEEVTVDAQDSFEIETLKLSDTSKGLENSEKSTSAIETDVVDLDSEDEVQEAKNNDVTTVNLPAGIEVIASHSSTACTDIRVKEGEIVISGVPKPATPKVARLNTAEVSIKTTKLPTLEVFNLDSDEDIDNVSEDILQVNVPETTAKKRKCVNDACPRLSDTYYVTDSSSMSFYNAKKSRYVCEICAEVVVRRNERLIEGIRNFEDLLSLDLGNDTKDLIEVLDSDSDDEVDPEDLAKELVGEESAKLLNEQLADIFNTQWKQYNMETRFLESVDVIKDAMAELEKKSKEVDEMLKECQKTTDKNRDELYDTFKPDIKELSPLIIYDVKSEKYTCTEGAMETRLSKRRMSANNENLGKRKLIDGEQKSVKNDKTAASGADDDNTDITVVQLSTENAPPDLPPVGELERPPLRVGMPVYAMRNNFGTWGKAHILEVSGASNSPFVTCRIKFDKAQKNMFKTLQGRYLAYCKPANARMTIGTRVIALFQGPFGEEKDNKQHEKFYSGIIAEAPNPVNKFRYLIFFDDGYAQYASHADTRLVYEFSLQVWEEVHPFSRLFVKEYLLNYPERPMVRLKAGETIRTEWKNKWWLSKVVKVDASLVLVQFTLDEAKPRLEWIYRGSTRLEPLYREIQAAGRQRQRAMPRAQAHSRPNMPIVEYTRSDEQIKSAEMQNIREINNEELRRQRAVARKSTAAVAPVHMPNIPQQKENSSSYSRVVYYTPKKAVRPYNITANHVCGPSCKRTDVLSLKELVTYNPLAKPLLSGWERQIVRSKYEKRVLYRAPCGRRVRNMKELLQYLQLIKSDMGVDLFDFGPATHCLAEFVINKYVVFKRDLANGKENVPIPCVNFYDDSLPEFCAYSTERTPTAGVPLNLDPEFLCGCDCEDDCEDKTKCACWKLTLEGAKTIGLENEDVGYVYKRLPEPLRTGIYECNSRCKCKSTCLNRVVQHPLQLKLQVFKTLKRGWGIRALNDVPKGSFICIYVGNLLTDATANLDGLNEGDEYLAELDYIEVVEQTKEGFEEDIPESLKSLDKKEDENTSEESETEEDEDYEQTNQSEDEEFKPIGFQPGISQFNKRLRKRKKKEEENEKKKSEEKEKESDEEGKGENSCITISDDEEVREPSRFTAAAGMSGSNFSSRYKSVRKLFGDDEACYIMDAKVQGNIGRYLNHSCCPNVFVQNVFVDTHDPRFPWVAFFASTHISTGSELTWNYNYDIGSVPGKVLYCYCGESICRGRLL